MDGNKTVSIQLRQELKAKSKLKKQEQSIGHELHVNFRDN
jgi:hypothetical protein